MSVSDVAILAGSLVLTGLLAWYFFGPKKLRQAELADGVQIVRVTVKGGYSPDVIQVASGVPVRMLFDRQESGDCSSRVVFPDFKVNQILPAFETTTVDFLPEALGEYGFACGMGMLHGTLRVVGGARRPWRHFRGRPRRPGRHARDGDRSRYRWWGPVGCCCCCRVCRGGGA
jgi:P-type Cu+ transporter